MKISIVYNYPVFGGDHDDYALRFALTYNAFPPGFKHDTVVICNGGKVTQTIKNHMECLGTFPGIRYFEHLSNSGKDIGGYQAVTRHVDGDWFVFFGGSAFFWKEGWLKAVADSVGKFGDTLYGTMVGKHSVVSKILPHMRSTCFWTTRDIMNRYPIKAVDNESRFEFEYRTNSITRWAVKSGFRPKIVTWNSIYDMKEWDSIPDGFQKSDQSGLLFKERLACEPYYTEKRNHTA